MHDGSFVAFVFFSQAIGAAGQCSSGVHCTWTSADTKLSPKCVASPSFTRSSSSFLSHSADVAHGFTSLPRLTCSSPSPTNSCGLITEVTFDASVVSILTGSFLNCANITLLDFSVASSLQSIDKYAFHGLTNLINVDFTGAVKLKTISGYVFWHTPSLTSVTLGPSIEVILARAFSNSNNLTSASTTASSLCSFLSFSHTLSHSLHA